MPFPGMESGCAVYDAGRVRGGEGTCTALGCEGEVRRVGIRRMVKECDERCVNWGETRCAIWRRRAARNGGDAIREVGRDARAGPGGCARTRKERGVRNSNPRLYLLVAYIQLNLVLAIYIHTVQELTGSPFHFGIREPHALSTREFSIYLYADNASQAIRQIAMTPFSVKDSCGCLLLRYYNPIQVGLAPIEYD